MPLQSCVEDAAYQGSGIDHSRTGSEEILGRRKIKSGRQLAHRRAQQSPPPQQAR